MVLPVARAPAAAERRSVRLAARRRSSSAQRLRAPVQQGSTQAVGYVLPLRPRCRQCALAKRRAGPCAVSAVPDSRRFADGLSPAARLAAVGSAASDYPAHRPAGSDASRSRLLPTAWRAARASTRAAASRSTPKPQRGRIRAWRSRARRCVPSRATACSTCSCRRCRTLEDYLELVAAVEATARGVVACR